MRAFKKALMAFAAVTAVSAAFAASSFAEALTADYAEGKVTVKTGLEAASGQMTVLLIEKGADADGITEDEILYINQAGANGNDTFGAMGVKGGALEEGKVYTLKIGSDADGFTLLSFDIDLTAQEIEDVWGDVNKDKIVNAQDVLKLVRHTSKIETIVYDAEDADKNAAELVARCDITLEGDINAQDVLKLVRHTSKIETIEGMVNEK